MEEGEERGCEGRGCEGRREGKQGTHPPNHRMYSKRREGGREGRRAYLKQHGTREVAKLEEFDVNVHVEGQLTATLFLFGFGVRVLVVERAGDALGLRGGKEGGRDGGQGGEGCKASCRGVVFVGSNFGHPSWGICFPIVFLSFILYCVDPPSLPPSLLTRSSLGRLEQISDKHWWASWMRPWRKAHSPSWTMVRLNWEGGREGGRGENTVVAKEGRRGKHV